MEIRGKGMLEIQFRKLLKIHFQLKCELVEILEILNGGGGGIV